MGQKENMRKDNILKYYLFSYRRRQKERKEMIFPHKKLRCSQVLLVNLRVIYVELCHQEVALR